MNRLLWASCLLISLTSYSQTLPPPYVPVADVLSQAKELYDSAKYDKAIERYLTISKRDTAYTQALSELAQAYIANKDYDKAIAAAEEGLQKTSIYHPEFTRLHGVAYERKGDFDKAVALFEKGLEVYPFDYAIMYNLGLAYYNHKDYDKATAQFFKILAIDPFHAGSHLNLGRMAAGQGKRTHALLSLGLYLSVSNKDNERLVLLEKVMSNQFGEDGSLPFSGENAFEKMDQIIKAGIAMDKNYKLKIPVNAATVRQYQMFFEQLSKVDNKPGDPWYAFYMPIYQMLKDRDLAEPFVYHILGSIDNDQVRKWTKKNDDRLKVFYAATNTELNKKRLLVTAPQLGYKAPVQAWYSGNNVLEALGKKDEAKVRQGHWVYFTDFVRVAEGIYSDAGKKIGVWKYYGNDGALTSVENNDSGEIGLYKNGVQVEHFFLKNGETDGVVELYNACGALREKLAYVNGKRQGKGTSYFSSGKLSREFAYESDQLTGAFINYYETGAVRNKATYVLGKAEGVFVEYHPNGKVSSTGNYKNGEQDGVWKYNHANGRLYRTGNLVNGTGTGEWTFYDARGNLLEKRMLDEKGNIVGEDHVYNDGKLYYTKTFKNGLLIKITYYDPGNKVIGSFGKNDGTFPIKNYYPTGQLLSEGAYKKGEIDGRWKFYYPEGTLRSEQTYKDGQAQGETIEYFHSGQKKYVMHHKDDEREGLYEEYFVHGQLKVRGYHVAGKREQTWYTYHPNGNLESDIYYLDGDFAGTTNEYAINGKKGVVTIYSGNPDHMTDITMLGADEKPVTQRVEKDKTGRVNFESYYKNGKPQILFETNCGEFTHIAKMFPDGKTFYDWSSLSGKREGPFKQFAMNGQQTREGYYRDGKADGVWKAFEADGAASYSGRYLMDEHDSTWTFNYFNGNVYYTREYKEDEADGIVRIFAPDGTPLLEKLYYSGWLVASRKIAPHEKQSDWTAFTGNQTLVATYASGKTAYEEKYVNGLLHGARKIYYSNGQLFGEYQFALGDYQGPFTIYFPDGKVEEKGTYKFDEQDGLYEKFYANGTPFIRENYQIGVLDGDATYYTKDGKPTTYHYYQGLSHD